MAGSITPLSVFVSSTIDEFKDLRSAIKVWLEELGFEVMMSEYTDFGREPERDTFDSCFQVIDRSDYFILLIGSDRGSPYGEQSSVTREEFGRALKRAREGHLKLIVFVRDEVMTALYERRELKRMMRDREILEPETMDVVENSINEIPSRTLRDSDFVRSFVEEVRATKLGTAPSGIAGSLWTYRFKGFGDIVAAMRSTMPVRRSLRRQALLANLDWELMELICELLSRGPHGTPITDMDWLKRVRAEVDLGEADLERQVWLNPEQVSRTNLFLVTAGAPTANFPASALQEAILSGEFLEFDQAQGRLVASNALAAMHQLAADIKRSAGLRASLDIPLWMPSIEALLQAGRMGRGAAVPVWVLGTIFAFHDTLVNVIRLAVALHRYVKWGSFTPPEVNPASPFAGMPEAIDAERVSHAQVDGWLDFMLPRKIITGLPEPDLDPLSSAGEEDLERMQELFPEWRWMIEAWDQRAQEMVDRLLSSEEYRRLMERGDRSGAYNWLLSEISRQVRPRQE